nr:MAG: replication polyprotein [Leptosphaeria biglobosa tymo-like virus 1]
MDLLGRLFSFIAVLGALLSYILWLSPDTHAYPQLSVQSEPIYRILPINQTTNGTLGPIPIGEVGLHWTVFLLAALQERWRYLASGVTVPRFWWLISFMISWGILVSAAAVHFSTRHYINVTLDYHLDPPDYSTTYTLRPSPFIITSCNPWVKSTHGGDPMTFNSEDFDATDSDNFAQFTDSSEILQPPSVGTSELEQLHRKQCQGCPQHPSDGQTICHAGFRINGDLECHWCNEYLRKTGVTAAFTMGTAQFEYERTDPTATIHVSMQSLDNLLPSSMYLPIRKPGTEAMPVPDTCGVDALCRAFSANRDEVKAIIQTLPNSVYSSPITQHQLDTRTLLYVASKLQRPLKIHFKGGTHLFGEPDSTFAEIVHTGNHFEGNFDPPSVKVAKGARLVAEDLTTPHTPRGRAPSQPDKLRFRSSKTLNGNTQAFVRSYKSFLGKRKIKAPKLHWKEYVPNPTRAKYLSRDVKNNKSGSLFHLQGKGDVPSKYCSQLDALTDKYVMSQGRPSVDIAVVYGMPGCGKSYALQEWIAHSNFSYKVSAPTQELRNSWAGSLTNKRESWRVGTYETNMLKTASTLIIDEISQMPPGYLDLALIADSTIKTVIVLGDHCQGKKFELNPDASVNALKAEVDYLSPLCVEYHMYTYRLFKKLANLWGVYTANPEEGFIRMIQTKPEKYPVITAKTQDAVGMCLNGFRALTANTAQGQSFNTPVTIILDHAMADKISNGSVNAVLTRSKKGLFITGTTQSAVIIARRKAIFRTVIDDAPNSYYSLFQNELIGKIVLRKPYSGWKSTNEGDGHGTETKILPGDEVVGNSPVEPDSYQGSFKIDPSTDNTEEPTAADQAYNEDDANTTHSNLPFPTELNSPNSEEPPKANQACVEEDADSLYAEPPPVAASEALENGLDSTTEAIPLHDDLPESGEAPARALHVNESSQPSEPDQAPLATPSEPEEIGEVVSHSMPVEDNQEGGQFESLAAFRARVDNSDLQRRLEAWVVPPWADTSEVRSLIIRLENNIVWRGLCLDGKVPHRYTVPIPGSTRRREINEEFVVSRSISTFLHAPFHLPGFPTIPTSTRNIMMKMEFLVENLQRRSNIHYYETHKPNRISNRTNQTSEAFKAKIRSGMQNTQFGARTVDDAPINLQLGFKRVPECPPPRNKVVELPSFSEPSKTHLPAVPCDYPKILSERYSLGDKDQLVKWGLTAQFAAARSDPYDISTVAPRHDPRRDNTLFPMSVKKRLRFATKLQNSQDYHSKRYLGEALYLAYHRLRGTSPNETYAFDDVAYAQCINENEESKLSKGTLALLQANAHKSDPDWRYTFVRIFIKSQQKISTTTLGTGVKAGQTLAQFNDRVILIYGPMTRYLSKLDDGLRPKSHYYHAGNSPLDLDSWCKTHMKGSWHKYKLTNDYTSFDRSQTGEVLAFEELRLRQSNLPHWVIESYMSDKVSLTSQLGPLATLRHTGEGPTWKFNTDMNYAMLGLMYDLGPDDTLMVSGDDCVVDGVPTTRLEYKYLARHFTLQAKTEITKQALFCSYIVGPYGAVKDPIPLAFKFMIAKNRPNYKNVSLSLLSEHAPTYSKGDDLYEILNEHQREAVAYINREGVCINSRIFNTRMSSSRVVDTMRRLVNTLTGFLSKAERLSARFQSLALYKLHTRADQRKLLHTLRTLGVPDLY